MRATISRGLACRVALLVVMTGCAHAPEPMPQVWSEQPPSTGPTQWSSLALPGKRLTRYRHVEHDGQAVILAQADSSASMYRQRVAIDSERIGTLAFSWWVPDLMPSADLTDRNSEDSPVRVVLAFDGDHTKLSAKNRMMFDLAEALTGESPPYATLMYVWDNRVAPESVIPAGRTDRIRKIVVDSGPGHLRSWRHHRRDIVRDFERAFGEAPGRLIGVALMTDSDNTASRTQALYGQLVFTSRDGAVRQFNE